MANAGHGRKIPMTTYVPPQVMKMGDMREATGECALGSGDAQDCRKYGSSAGDRCVLTGSSAVGACVPGSGHK